MNISDVGISLVKSCEGYMKKLPDGRCMAYQEVLGHKNGEPILDIPTIGWGTTEGVAMGMVWTRDEATSALHRELQKHERIVSKLVTVDMTQGMFDALVSFSYNTGSLGKSTLLKKLNSGNTIDAASEFSKFTKAAGKVQPGLVHRRAAEKALFLSTDEETGHPMPQTVDAPKRKPTPAEMATAAAAAAGSITTVAHQSGAVPVVTAAAPKTLQDHLDAGRARIDQAKQARDIVQDAAGIIPGLPNGSDVYIIPGAILAIGLTLAFVMHKRSS